MTGRILTDSIVTSTGKYTMLALGVLRNFYVARLLGPEHYNYWILFLLALLYADQVHLGLRQAGEREIPILRGKNNDAEATDSAAAIFAGTMLFSVVALLLVLAVASIVPEQARTGDYDVDILRSGLVFIAVIILTDQIGRFFLMYLHTRKRFVTGTMTETGAEVLRTALVIVLGSFYHLTGAFVAYAAASAAMALFCLVAFRGGLHIRWRGRLLRRLFSVGIPLFLNAIAALLIISLDRIAGGALLSARDFSYYGFATTLVLLPVFASHAFREVLYPSMGEQFGAGGFSASFLRLCTKALYAIGYITPLLVCAVLFGGELLVRLFLPAFAASIPMMYALSHGIYFMSIASISAAALIIAGKVWVGLVIEAVAVAAAWCTYIGLPPLLGQSYALAAGTCVLYFLYGFLSLIVLFRYCGLASGPLLNHTIQILLPSLAGMAVVTALQATNAISWGGSQAAQVLASAGKAALFVLAYAAIAIAMRKRTNIIPLLRASFRPERLP